jgi:hypothetical protein
VWFDDYYNSLRIGRVASEVRRLEPHLLCLQEVNAKLLLMQDPQLRQLGYCTQSVLRYAHGKMLWWRSLSVQIVLVVMSRKIIEFLIYTKLPFHTNKASFTHQIHVNNSGK